MAITSHKGMALLGEWIVYEKKNLHVHEHLVGEELYIYIYINKISTNNDRKATYVLLKYTKKVINLIFWGLPSPAAIHIL